jgi:hypothetical protein
MTKKVIRSMADIPATFPDENTEAAFWESHELSEELLRERRVTAPPLWLPAPKQVLDEARRK